MEGLGYDAVNRTMYVSYGNSGSSYLSNRLGMINSTNGIITHISTISGSVDNEMDAIAFIGENLYGIDVAGEPSYLYSLNKTIARASTIGQVAGYNNINDIAYDATTDKLYAAATPARSLITINPSTGEATLVGITHASTEFGGGGFSSVASTNVLGVVTSNVAPQNTNKKMSIYPSPADDFVFVNNSFNGDIQITLTSISGVNVLNETISTGTIQMSVEGVSPGLYHYQILSQDQILENGKLMIK